MRKPAKKILAVLSAMLLTVSALGLSSLAAIPEDVTEFVTVIQDFDSLTVGAVSPDGAPNTGAVLGPGWWATAYSGAEVVARAEDDNWLKVVGNAGTPYGSPIRMQKNVDLTYSNANIAPADSDTLLFYVKGDESKDLKILPVFYEHNPTSIGYVGGRWAATAAVDYTLITAEGAVSAVQSEDCYLYIEAGFEGWVLYPLDNATYRYDDGNSEEDGNTKEVLDPGRLLAIELQTYNDTAGAVWYLDDMALTSQSDDVIDALEVAPAKTDDAPEGVDMYFGQGFGKTEVGDGRDGLSAVAAIQGESDASNIQYLVTDNTLNQGNALSMTFNGDAGNFITTNFTEIGLHFSDEDRAAMASADSLVLRVKTPADTKYAHFDMMLMLEESVLTDSGRDRGGVGGVFMNRGDFSVNPGSVTLVDAATNQYVVNEFNDPYFMPNGFDGWVILPLSYFKLHPAYAGSDNNGELDVDELVRLKFQVENAPCGETFVLDSIGAAKATDFLASLNASEKPVDQTVVLQPGQTDPVSSNILQYVKDNEVNLTVVYEDGYPLYTWKFAGKDITSTDAFDAVLVNECDEVNAVKAMYKPFTGYFFKTAALPGKAALSIYLGDDYMAPSLYRYADGKCEKVGALTVDSEGYATLELAEGGVYFLTEATLEAVEGTTPAQPDTDPSTKPDPNPSTGYVFPMAVLLLPLVSAAAALLLRKKAVR